MVVKLRLAQVYDIMEGRHADFPTGLDKNQRLHVYNAADCIVTLKVHEALAPKLAASSHATTSYNFVRAMQGPALDMMRRGVAIQQEVRSNETVRYTAIREEAQSLLDRMADAVWGPETYTIRTKREEWYTTPLKRGGESVPKRRVLVDEVSQTRPRGLNPNSPNQMLAFFNLALGFPVEYEIRKTAQGKVRTPSVNGKALRKWAERKTKGLGINPRDHTVEYVQLAQPFVSLILTIRDADKMLGVLRSPLDADGRMRCSYNVVGTENGRWSSSDNAFGRGTNLQNITPTMRRMFCADDGCAFVSTDLEQAESRLVAALVWQSTGDDTYWTACESSDLHTTVARMTWPELDWNDNPKHNRSVADRPFPLLPKFTYREVSKRTSHGSNYRGSPFGIAQAVGIPASIVQDFQARYFLAFPGLRKWHDWTVSRLAANRYLDTPLSRRRWFFGRPDADDTIREAIAFVPQSTIGELLNLAVYNVWKRTLLPRTDLNFLPIQLLLQNHDAFAFQVPQTADLPSILAAVKHELEIPIPIVRGNETRTLTIPGEFVTGWNWAYADTGADPSKWKFQDGNPDGLRKWSGHEGRTRQQRAKTTVGDWLKRTQGGWGTEPS